MRILDWLAQPNIRWLRARRDIDGLARALSCDDPKIRLAAARALGELGDRRAVLPLLERFESNAVPSSTLSWRRALERQLRPAVVRALADLGDTRAIEPFVRALSEWEVRSQLVEALVRFGEAAVPQLIAALRDRDTSRHHAAAEALGTIGPPAVPFLIETLRSYDHEVRTDAIWGLGLTRDRRAVGPLLDALADRRLCDYAAPALERIGDKSAVGPLLSALEITSPSHRAAAARVLGTLGDDAAFQPLIRALDDSERGVRRAAAVALSQLGWQPPADHEAAAYWATQHEWDKCVSMGDLALDPLRVELRDAYSRERPEIIRALGAVGPAAVADLVELLRVCEPREVTVVTEELVRLREPAVEPLIELLASSEASTRKRASEALAVIGDSSIPSLRAAIADARPGVRRETAGLLGRLADRHAIDSLLRLLVEDEDASVRASAAAALEQLGWQPPNDQHGAQFLVERRRWADCVALGAAHAFNPLTTALRSQDPEVRAAAAKSLGDLGDQRAIKPLRTALQDKEYRVRSSAESALERITGRPLRPRAPVTELRPQPAAFRSAETEDRGYRTHVSTTQLPITLFLPLRSDAGTDEMLQAQDASVFEELGLPAITLARLLEWDDRAPIPDIFDAFTRDVVEGRVHSLMPMALKSAFVANVLTCAFQMSIWDSLEYAPPLADQLRTALERNPEFISAEAWQRVAGEPTVATLRIAGYGPGSGLNVHVLLEEGRPSPGTWFERIDRAIAGVRKAIADLSKAPYGLGELALVVLDPYLTSADIHGDLRFLYYGDRTLAYRFVDDEVRLVG